MAQSGHEIVIKDGETAVARLLPPANDLLTVIPAKRSLKELLEFEPVQPEKLRLQELEDAVRWAKSDWIDRQRHE